MNTIAQDYRIDLHRLPVEEEIKGHKGGGIFLIVFSLFFGGMPGAFLLMNIIGGTLEYEMLFVSIFVLVGLGIFLAGLNQFFIRGMLRIDHKEIHFQKNSLFKNRCWTESIDRYMGVTFRSEYHSGGKNRSSYTLYIIELHHEEKEKRVVLYRSRSESGVRALWEETCRTLHLPAVEETAQGLVRRDVEDLDKSVRQLVAEEKVKVEFDHRKRPPDGLALDVDGDRLVITVHKKCVTVLGALIMLLFPAVFIYLGFFLEDVPLVFGFAGVFMELIMTIVLVALMIIRPMIMVSPERIELLYDTPWGAFMPIRIAADDIEQVQIQKLERTRMKALVIVTDFQRKTFGAGLDDRSLEWLKSCILKVISAPKGSSKPSALEHALP